MTTLSLAKEEEKKNDLAATIRELRLIDGYPSDCASAITERHNEYQLTRQHDCTLLLRPNLGGWILYYVKRRP